ncbi:unnamed protein product [Penicillium pancosmium]
MSNIPPATSFDRVNLHLTALRRVIHHLADPNWTRNPTIITNEAREGVEHIREALLEIPQLREQLQEMTRELETLRVQFEVLGGLPPAS